MFETETLIPHGEGLFCPGPINDRAAGCSELEDQRGRLAHPLRRKAALSKATRK